MCEYCNGKEQEQQPLESDDHSVWTVISNDSKIECIDSLCVKSFLAKINYCPMCGRNLEERK